MTWRTATADDAVALRDLEREANLVGLAHVFPGLPFPDDGVLARWEATLADPSVTTEVFVDPQPRHVGDATGRLRHLAVHPDRWGSGLATAGIERAVARSAPPGASRCCGCWSPTTGRVRSTSTSAGSRPGASSRPSGPRTRPSSSCVCQNSPMGC